MGRERERDREGKPGMSYPWVLSLGSTGLLMWRRFVKGKGENGWWWKGKRKKKYIECRWSFLVIGKIDRTCKIWKISGAT